MHIVSHVGTGHEIVRDIVEDAGHEITFINTFKDAGLVEFDRLILLGGRDVNPFLYGELIIDAQRPDVNRDKIEWLLVRRAMTKQIPMMGICRGCQMINIAHGGSLYQDIYTHLGIDHPHGERHPIKVVGPLAKKIPSKVVNSLHHQSIKTVPYSFKVAATSLDGVIEAIYRPGVLGIQWHPELMVGKNSKWLSLFQWWLDGLDQ